MEFFLQFLLISSLSIMIAESIEHLDKAQIERLIAGGPFFLIGLPETLKLLEGGEIYRTNSTVVWKGEYDDTVDVAIKVFNVKKRYEREMRAYRRLNATEIGFDSIRHRIPRVYYDGPIFGNFYAIAMTLFEENVENHFKNQGYQFSLSTILLICKQVVEALKYVHSRGVLHNHIQLTNTFTSFHIARRLFIADFDTSHLDKPEHLITDYNQLIGIVQGMLHPHTLDNIAGSSGGKRTLQRALEDILNADVIRVGNYALPDYDEVIAIADEAITEIENDLGPVQFDWMSSENNH